MLHCRPQDSRQGPEELTAGGQKDEMFRLTFRLSYFGILNVGENALLPTRLRVNLLCAMLLSFEHVVIRGGLILMSLRLMDPWDLWRAVPLR